MYETLKILIENGTYEKDTILRKIKVYLKAKKITDEQYNELLNMI